VDDLDGLRGLFDIPDAAPIEHDTQLDEVHSFFSGALKGQAHAFAKILREEIDWLVDSVRTGRTLINELEGPEKTYLGTRIERAIRSFFNLEKGRHDLVVNGIDVDVKNTVASNWMIGQELAGVICLIVKISEEQSCFDMGLVRATADVLTTKPNSDRKRSVSARGRSQIRWLLKAQPLPLPCTAVLPTEVWREIARLPNGNERVAELFRSAVGKIVTREAVHVAAKQKDFMKRIRKNGGARDLLEAEGILVLGDKKHERGLASQLGFPVPARGEFLSIALARLTSEQREVAEAVLRAVDLEIRGDD
jgi:hypothetical protein